jgi:hypothetical protein
MKILIGVDGSSASDATVQEKTLRPWPKESAASLACASLALQAAAVCETADLK